MLVIHTEKKRFLFLEFDKKPTVFILIIIRDDPTVEIFSPLMVCSGEMTNIKVITAESESIANKFRGIILLVEPCHNYLNIIYLQNAA